MGKLYGKRKANLDKQLKVMQELCDEEDRSTEYMLQFLTDSVDIDSEAWGLNLDSHEYVMNFLEAQSNES